MAEGPITISRYVERLSSPAARWYFTKEELHNSPSRAHGVDPAKELNYRQQAANLIQDMGHRLNLNQLCTATAIVYMHRFFIVHSFKSFQRFNVATAALFLAAKVEEQPRKLEYVSRVSYACQNRDSPPLDGQSDTCKKLMEEVSFNELLLLQTLGFEVAVQHPHAHVVKGTQLVRASKDLSQTAYFMSHNSLLLTTFCLQYPPTVVACVCIHLACNWKGIEIPLSADGKNWWEYIDENITLNELNDHTDEFLKIYKMCPSRLQKKIMESVKMGQSKGDSSKHHPSSSRPLTSSDKTKGHTSHPSKHKPQLSSSSSGQPHHPKAPKPGHGVSNTSTQPHKHSSNKHAPSGSSQPSSHVSSSHNAHTQHTSHTLSNHPPPVPPHSGHVTSHSGHVTSHSGHVPPHSGSTQDSKPHLSRPTTHQKPSNSSRVPPKHSKPHEEHHKAKTNSHHSGLQPNHHHHQQAAPGHIPNAAKPSDVMSKHRALASEHKARPDGRHGNPLKRPHPVDNHDAKRVKLEASHSGSLPPLPADTLMNSLSLPPLPTQSPMDMPPLPPPLPADPPPNFWGLSCSPPPPPPPN